MSGQSGDDEVKSQILELLNKLSESARLNKDTALEQELRELWSRIYDLQTY